MSRAEKVALIRWARDTFPELVDRERAQLIGMSLSAYYNLLGDPDGSKQRARRERYTGVCVDCGGPTDGSNGPRKTSKRCEACYRISQRAAKIWTAEAVVDAIRRYAAIHGRPPTSTDWLHADPVNGYPARTSCYRSQWTASSPFATWADAIEAAGFPRPLTGHWQDESRRSARALERVGPLQQQLLDDLGDGPCRITWLAAGRSYSSVNYALRMLIVRGLIVRISRGVYRRTA